MRAMSYEFEWVSGVFISFLSTSICTLYTYTYYLLIIKINNYYYIIQIKEDCLVETFDWEGKRGNQKFWHSKPLLYIV